MISDEFFERIRMIVRQEVERVVNGEPQEVVEAKKEYTHDYLRDLVRHAIEEADSNRARSVKGKIKSLLEDVGARVVPDVPKNKIEYICNKIEELYIDG